MRLIDADALIDVILNDHKLDGTNANWEVNRILVHIKNSPTVELFCHYQYDGEVKEPCVESPCHNRVVGQPTGEWIKHDFRSFGGLGDWSYRCSNCDTVFNGATHFCPQCGAKMLKGEE